MHPLKPPVVVDEIASAVRDVGGRAFLVGGCVRDHLLRRPVADWDIEVFGVDVERLPQLLKPFGKVNLVGRAFGVFKVRPRQRGVGELDVSIPRRDSKVGPGHTGIQARGDPDMTVDEAARRRDLTVNAILYDIVEQRLVDPFGGVGDLRDGRLRAVDRTTFLEDPLRALRAVQFAARLDFAVDPTLIALCQQARLDELPAERLLGEWAKLLLKGSRPSAGLALARAGTIFQRVFPMLQPDSGLDDRLDGLVGYRDPLDEVDRRFTLMCVGWLWAQPLADAEKALDVLGLHRFEGGQVRKPVLAALAARELPHDTAAHLRRLADAAQAEIVLAVRDADGQDVVDALAAVRRDGIAWSAPKRLLQGRDLKGVVAPGPQMGVLLKRVYEAQLDGDVADRDSALALARQLAGGVMRR